MLVRISSKSIADHRKLFKQSVDRLSNDIIIDTVPRLNGIEIGGVLVPNFV